jgi:hypothetical protein
MQNQLRQLVGDLATGWPEFGEIERDTETERDTESERDRGIRERECDVLAGRSVFGEIEREREI